MATIARVAVHSCILARRCSFCTETSSVYAVHFSILTPTFMMCNSLEAHRTSELPFVLVVPLIVRWTMVRRKIYQPKSIRKPDSVGHIVARLVPREPIRSFHPKHRTRVSYSHLVLSARPGVPLCPVMGGKNLLRGPCWAMYSLKTFPRVSSRGLPWTNRTYAYAIFHK